MGEAKRGSKNHRSNWIRSLLKKDLYPIIEAIEKVNHSLREEKEKYWIKFYGRDSLVNETDGGEGVLGYIYTNEDRERMSKSHLGKKTWNKGIKTNTSHLAKFQFKKGFSPSNKGLSLDSSVKEKISKSKIGKSYGKNSRTKGKCFGVTYEEKNSKWIAQIRYNKKSYFIGKYLSEELSGIAYDICSIWISKEIRLLNFPENKEKYKELLKDSDIRSLKELRLIINEFIGGKQ